MKASKIKKLTLKNGGYTDSQNTARYIVAIKGYEKQVPVKNFCDKVILGYKKIAKAQGNILGTWLHEGVVYLDNVQAFSDLEEALKVAKAQGELAIFDSFENKEIIL